MKTRTYKGMEIKEYTGPYGRFPDRREPRYYIQTHHSPTGIPWSPENCPVAWSLREAREKIDQMCEYAND